jgi:CDP-diacylglycerol--glycerol-3-phosphate 3-phosphatidyltransferase
MNLPNSLTVARIVLAPLLVVVLLTKFEGRRVLGAPEEVVAAAIFALAALTDWLDGFFARRRQQITTAGQWMDPIADKLLTTAALISLVQLDAAPAWMAAVLIGRDLAVTGLRGVAYSRGVSIPSSRLGKLKMATQTVAILVLILGRNGPDPLFLSGRAALWLATILSVWSGWDYYRRFSRLSDPKVADIAAARARAEARRRADRHIG